MKNLLYLPDIDTVLKEVETYAPDLNLYEDFKEYLKDLDPYLVQEYMGIGTSTKESNPFDTQPHSYKELLMPFLSTEDFCDWDGAKYYDNWDVLNKREKLEYMIEAEHIKHIVPARKDPNSEIRLSKEIIQYNPSEQEIPNRFFFRASQIFNSLAFKLDMYSDLYFNLLYNLKLKQHDFVELLDTNWSKLKFEYNKKDVLKEIRSGDNVFLRKLHDYPTDTKSLQFEIEFAPNNRRKVLNVAPNIPRLLILSNEFRTLLRNTDCNDRKKFDNLLAELENCIGSWSIKLDTTERRIMEHLLNLDTINALNDMFSLIFRSQKKEYIDKKKPQISHIIKLFMKWPGVHGRLFFINEYINFYNHITRNVGSKNTDAVLQLLQDDLEKLITPKSINTYKLYLKDFLLSEYLHCSKDENKLLLHLEKESTALEQTVRISRKLYNAPNKLLDTPERHFLTQFIYGTTLTYRNIKEDC